MEQESQSRKPKPKANVLFATVKGTAVGMVASMGGELTGQIISTSIFSWKHGDVGKAIADGLKKDLPRAAAFGAAVGGAVCFAEAIWTRRADAGDRSV